jgi:hypothetical protein
MPTPGVDFFRVDRSGSTRRLLGMGIVMVAGGASAVGVHLMHRVPESTGHLVSLAGGLSMITGLVSTFGALAMMLFEDVYLSIREDGLLLHDNGKETVIAWDDLTKVVVSAGFVELSHKKREPADGAVAAEEAKADVRWFAGKGAPNVAARIEEAKRKAAHGLLRS